MTRRPNVLWITTHDINPHLGAYAGVYPGAEDAITPNLDRLAAEGCRFDRAFAAAPVCAPSRSAIATGCYPIRIGTMHMRTKAVPPPEVRLLGEYLRAAGYYVTNAGFTDFQMLTPVSAFDDCSDTAHWRNRPDPAQPFFATFHGLVTHESQIALEDAAFAARTAHVRDEDRHDPDAVTLPPYYPDTTEFRTAWARYHDLVTEMDHGVGELLRQLDEDGLAEDTIVVFWSDHGVGLPRAKRWANDSGLHEPLVVRWPGRIPAGSTEPEVVELLDLAPSMLAAVGLPVPEHMDGAAFLDPTGTVSPRPDALAYASRDRQGDMEDRTRTVRDRRYRYVRHDHPGRPAMPHSNYPDALVNWAAMRRAAGAETAELTRGMPRTVLTPLQRTLIAPSKPPEELYDLDADPYEEHNLAGDPAFDDDRRRLAAALEAWTDRCDDLGRLDEEALLERWRPGGAWTRPVPPTLGPDGAVVSTTPGTVVVWSDHPDEVGAEDRDLDAEVAAVDPIGAPTEDFTHWNLASPHAPVPRDRTVTVRAVRLGAFPSERVTLPATADAP